MSKYTKNQIKELISLRNDGCTWSEVAEILYETFGIDKTPNAVRKAYKRFNVKPSKTTGGLKLKKSSNYVITSYIPGSSYDKKFLKTLKHYCKVNNAELVILETKVNYKSDGLHDDLLSGIPQKGELPRNLNNNLMISEYKPGIDLIDPIAGLDPIVMKLGCLIVPSPKQRFKMIPRSLKKHKTPRAIWCTGTISDEYYKTTKQGTNARMLHTQGALIVNIQNKEQFHIRQLQWDGDGFYDLNRYYSGNRTKKDNIEALSMGDDHVVYLNPKITKATKEIIKSLKPNYVFHHDTFDASSVSHHVVGKHITKAKVNLTLEQEGKLSSDYLANISNKSGAKHVTVASNHPEHLGRYLDECRYRDDYPNHILALELALDKAYGKDPVECLLKKYNNLNHIEFLTRKDSYIVKGIELGDHGDFGANGSRGTPKGKGIAHSGNSVTGHTHAPEIGIYNNFVNGTSTYLSLPYTSDSGESSWFNTHTIVYKNGKRTHIHMLPNGKVYLGGK